MTVLSPCVGTLRRRRRRGADDGRFAEPAFASNMRALPSLVTRARTYRNKPHLRRRCKGTCGSALGQRYNHLYVCVCVFLLFLFFFFSLSLPCTNTDLIIFIIALRLLFRYARFVFFFGCNCRLRTF